VPTKPTHAIQLVYKLHQREYTSEEVLTKKEFGLREGAWVWSALVAASKVSLVKRLQKSEVRAALVTLRRLSTNPRWRKLSNLSPSDLTTDLVHEMFVLLEADLAERATLGSHSRQSTSLRTRSLLLRYLEAKRSSVAGQVKKRFRTRFQKGSDDHRKLISDDAIKIDGETLPPVGAIPHKSIQHLRELTESTLLRPQTKIEDACAAALEEYESAVARLNALSLEPVDEDLYQSILKYIGRTTKIGAVPPLVDVAPIEEVVKVYLRFATTQAKHFRFQMFRGHEISRYLKANLKQSWHQMMLFGPELFDNHHLLVCLVALACHTKWNGNAVLEVVDGWITSKDTAKPTTPPFDFHGFKTRIGKKTTFSTIEASDQNAVKAVVFLRNRLARLKELGMVDADEQRLWLNLRQLNSEGKPRPYVSWQWPLSKFIERYSLPHFSLDQIRLQGLNILSVRPGGLAAAKEVAGHTSIRTTGIYIDQGIVRRMSSSINLEFQRRLEQEIESIATDPDAKRIGLLRPIGDGAYCADPSHPPLEDYLQNGICDAKSCHLEGGCKNRRLVVNEESMEAALRMSYYYQRNWIRLIDENRDRFMAYHLPAMLFNFAYIEVLGKGPYGHKLKSIRLRIRNG
jgi:hypothetical protein